MKLQVLLRMHGNVAGVKKKLKKIKEEEEEEDKSKKNKKKTNKRNKTKEASKEKGYDRKSEVKQYCQNVNKKEILLHGSELSDVV